MAYDLEEQEQIDALKAWWKQYGNLVTWVLIIALGAYSAWSGWKYYERRQAAQASQLYEEMHKAIAAKDNALVQRAAADMKDKFGRTTYAQMAGMIASRVAYEAGDIKATKEQLEWVAANAIDDEYKALAKIRLAGILLDEKAYDEGLKLVSGDYPEAFASLVADRKGDILVAQEKIDDARAAYQLALDKADPKDPARQLIQLKLDGIGGAPAAKPAA
ncbi:MAG: tetratricopeptide repeat protein [Burkholderiaceae bacterium]|nr:tetratricopeptide repeat protein [Burkholderiaceae bacterium]